MAVLLLATLLVGCKDDEEVTWTQYNADGESIDVDVGAAKVEPARTAVLHSNTGSIEIGAASVDPGGGPLGTVHTVRVDVLPDYASGVGRVSVRTSSGERGEDEYDLVADSTGEGIWLFQLTSQGEGGEARTDTFTFRLWASDDQADTGG
jgi:hypothetical protein